MLCFAMLPPWCIALPAPHFPTGMCCNLTLFVQIIAHGLPSFICRHSTQPNPTQKHTYDMYPFQPRQHNPRLRAGGAGQRLRPPGPCRPREGAGGTGNSQKIPGQKFHRGGRAGGVEMAGGAVTPLVGQPAAEGGDCAGAPQRGRVSRRERRGCGGGGGWGFGKATVLYVQVGGAPFRKGRVLGAG